MAEIYFRNRGIWTSGQLIDQVDSLFSPKHAMRIRKSHARFELARKLGLLDILINSFPCGHRVRVLEDFYNSTLFLDIETTGTHEKSQITCISTFRNGIARTFVNGQNLDDFLYEWQQAQIVVAFNGKRFDFPHLQKTFKFTTTPAQIDLMEEARQLLCEAVEECLMSNRYADWNRIKLVIRDTMNDFIWKKTKRKPMVLPIIMDV